MNETLGHRSSGITANALHTWAMLFTVAGIAGRAIIQNAMLGVSDLTGTQLLQLLESNPDAMGMLTVALVLEFIYACAAPIYAFLLVEGFTHTSNFKNYVLRMAALAVVAEIPYNLAMNGQWLHTATRNPVFAMVLCLVMLYQFSRYPEKSFNHIVIKGFVILAAFLWVSMLRIDEGSSLLLLTAVIWAVRNRQNFRAIICCTAAFVCTIFSTYYLLAPFTFLVLHYYGGERNPDNKLAHYMVYPVLLLAFGLVAMYAF